MADDSCPRKTDAIRLSLVRFESFSHDCSCTKAKPRTYPVLGGGFFGGTEAVERGLRLFDWSPGSEGSSLAVKDHEDSGHRTDPPRGHTHPRSPFPSFLPGAHKCAHCPLYSLQSCPLSVEPQVSGGQGRYHSFRGNKDGHSEGTFPGCPFSSPCSLDLDVDVPSSRDEHSQFVTCTFF